MKNSDELQFAKDIVYNNGWCRDTSKTSCNIGCNCFLWYLNGDNCSDLNALCITAQRYIDEYSIKFIKSIKYW